MLIESILQDRHGMYDMGVYGTLDYVAPPPQDTQPAAPQDNSLVLIIVGVSVPVVGAAIGVPLFLKKKGLAFKPKG